MASSGSSDVVDGGSSTIEEEGVRKASSPTPPPRGLSSLPYLRIQKRGRHYDVQTAVTTFQKAASSHDVKGQSKTTVDLHAQVHFGDASYFQYFNDDTFNARYDSVLYELITEDRFLAPIANTLTLKQLAPFSNSDGNRNPVAPTQADRATASQYGLQCQVDGIQYCREGWVHADLTREEFLGWLEDGPENQPVNSDNHGAHRQPLWALASTAPTFPCAELLASLARPPHSASAALTRRLFTHLFLPGDALAGWIRAALWLGVPTPELSILLVDWSSLAHVGRRVQDAAHRITPLSPIAAPVLLSLVAGRWGTARRLLFGQVLASGQANADTSKRGVLIERRNERAIGVLREALSLERTRDGEELHRIALLYGAGHCRDLHRRLVQEEHMTPVRTEWRTAFRATAPRWGDFVNVDRWQVKSRGLAARLPSSMTDGKNIVKATSVSTLESVAVGLVILPLYLLVGGLDWVSTMGELVNSVDAGSYLDGAAAVLLYLVRHVALYVGISKFVVDWDGNEGIFEDDERA